MITEADLESKGYRKYLDRSYPDMPRNLWQKAVREGNTIRYYINVYLWDWSKLTSRACTETPTFSAEAVLYLETRETFKVNFYPEADTTVQATEEFYAKIYKVMHCVPDILNN